MSNKKITIIISLVILTIAVVFFALVNFNINPFYNFYINNPSYTSIAVDSNENIYLGSLGQITVISKDGVKLKYLLVNSDRGFTFNIIDDKIFMDTEYGYYVTDLNGNKLNSTSTYNYDEIMQSRNRRHCYTDSNTEYYIMLNHVFCKKNGKIKMIY